MGVLHTAQRHMREWFGQIAARAGWQTRKGMIWWIAGLLLLLLVFLFGIWYAAGEKNITLVVDGTEMAVETREDTVLDLLSEHNIRLGTEDNISRPLYAQIHDGDRIVVEHAFAVQLIDGGRSSTRWTTADTVQEALRDLDIELDDDDEVRPAPNAEIGGNATIEIVRVERKFRTAEETIPFETIEKRDKNLLKGTTEVRQEGKEGRLLKTIEEVWKNNELVSRQVIDEKVEQESTDRIVAVGTRVPVQVLSASSPNIREVTKNGVTFGVKKILDNVTLTAYDAGYNSTGKTEDHPMYGITYTGRKVEEGRTVAVDPKVIPLGWWIYIEGIGFRRAEDIGSAIKGKKIDIYMDSEAQANKFGLKRGYTVYIIGPEKPAALE